jgi:hypothetical protein
MNATAMFAPLGRPAIPAAKQFVTNNPAIEAFVKPNAQTIAHRQEAAAETGPYRQREHQSSIKTRHDTVPRGTMTGIFQRPSL